MSPVVRRILAGSFLSQLGSGLTFALLVVYLGQVRGLGTALAGLVIAYMAVVSLLLTPLTGMSVDHFGARRVLIGGLLVEAGAVASLPLVNSAASAFVVATVLTTGAAFTWGPQSSLLGRLTPTEQRQRVFGIQFLLLNLGLGLGGVVSASIVTVADPSSFTRLYLIDALSYLAYVVVLLTMRGVANGPEATKADGQRLEGGYREVLADRLLLRVAFLGFVLATCGYGAMQVALPVFMTQISNLAVSWVAIAYTVNTLVIVGLQMTVLKRMQGRSRTRMLVVVAAFWALTWLILAGTSYLSPALAIIGACLSTGVFALGEMLWAPIAPSLVNDLAPDHLRGRYNSVQGLVWGVAGALGPAITGVLLGGGHIIWWTVLITTGCLAAGVMAMRLGRRLSPELDGRVPASADGGTMHQ
ncbi:MAG: MFS transporter [Actinomycetes bacterium]